jgi:hypothetical protein
LLLVFFVHYRDEARVIAQSIMVAGDVDDVDDGEELGEDANMSVVDEVAFMSDAEGNEIGDNDEVEDEVFDEAAEAQSESEFEADDDDVSDADFDDSGYQRNNKRKKISQPPKPVRTIRASTAPISQPQKNRQRVSTESSSSSISADSADTVASAASVSTSGSSGTSVMKRRKFVVEDDDEDDMHKVYFSSSYLLLACTVIEFLFVCFCRFLFVFSVADTGQIYSPIRCGNGAR